MELPIVDGVVIEENCISVGSEEWYVWLKTIKSFKYQPIQTAKYRMLNPITVRNRSGSYWYAYRKLNNKQRQLYVGKTEDLDYLRLQKVAEDLSLDDTEYYKLIADRKKVVQPKKYTPITDSSDGCTASLMYNPAKSQELEERNKQLQQQVEQITQDNNRLHLQLEEVQQELSAKRELQQLQVQHQLLEAKYQQVEKQLLDERVQLAQICIKHQNKEKRYTANSASGFINDVKSIVSKALAEE